MSKTNTPARVPHWRVRADAIERARILSGRTRQQLAKDAHVDEKTLRDMLSGRRRPTIATVHCVVRAVGVDPRDAIVFEGGA
jgi:DNA-binding phage protein